MLVLVDKPRYKIIFRPKIRSQTKRERGRRATMTRKYIIIREAEWKEKGKRKI